MQHDYYRYHNHSLVAVAMDSNGQPTSWHHRVVAPSIMARWLPGFTKDGVDLDAVDDAQGPYDIPNVLVEFSRNECAGRPEHGQLARRRSTRNVFVVERDRRAGARGGPRSHRVSKGDDVEGAPPGALPRSSWRSASRSGARNSPRAAAEALRCSPGSAAISRLWPGEREQVRTSACGSHRMRGGYRYRREPGHRARADRGWRDLRPVGCFLRKGHRR